MDDPAMPQARVGQVIAIIEDQLLVSRDGKAAEHHEMRLSIAAHRVLHITPIKSAGTLLFWSVLDMIHLQSELVPLGILVRGAIALGDAAVQGDLILGHGIAEAERLRDEVASVPRVIVDPRLLRELEQNPFLRAGHHNVMQELGYLHDLLRQDGDGLWFADYLWAFRSEVREPQTYFDFFKEHRRLVTRRLEASTALDRSSHASAWLWHYHNRVFEDLKTSWPPDDRDELAELRIPATSPLVYDFPPAAKAYGAP
jgi:hypothetical protein